MKQPVDRRSHHRDPREVLSPEVLALLRACGGSRKTDHAVLDSPAAAPVPTPAPSRTMR